jgi:hypothetical protein
MTAPLYVSEATHLNMFWIVIGTPAANLLCSVRRYCQLSDEFVLGDLQPITKNIRGYILISYQGLLIILWNS